VNGSVVVSSEASSEAGAFAGPGDGFDASRAARVVASSAQSGVVELLVGHQHQAELRERGGGVGRVGQFSAGGAGAQMTPDGADVLAAQGSVLCASAPGGELVERVLGGGQLGRQQPAGVGDGAERVGVVVMSKCRRSRSPNRSIPPSSPVTRWTPESPGPNTSVPTRANGSRALRRAMARPNGDVR
jgi:hypothetical protein